MVDLYANRLTSSHAQRSYEKIDGAVDFPPVSRTHLLRARWSLNILLPPASHRQSRRDVVAASQAFLASGSPFAPY